MNQILHAFLFPHPLLAQWIVRYRKNRMREPEQKFAAETLRRMSSVTYLVQVAVIGYHLQQTGHQPGMVANPARGQLNRGKYFPVPVRA